MILRTSLITFYYYSEVWVGIARSTVRTKKSTKLRNIRYVDVFPKQIIINCVIGANDDTVNDKHIWIKAGPFVAAIVSVHPSKKANFVLLLVFTKNDESYISVVLSDDNDTSSH